MEKSQQELLFQFSMLEQQIQNLQQQLRAIEEAIVDVNTLNLGLDDLKDSVGKEIMAPLGRGIFVKTRLISDKMVVDVGGRNFVTKSVSETKNIVESQSKKLEEIKEEILAHLEGADKELSKIVSQASENKEAE